MILITNLCYVELCSVGGETLLTVNCSAILIEPTSRSVRGFGADPAWQAFRCGLPVISGAISKRELDLIASSLRLQCSKGTVFKLYKAQRGESLLIEEFPDNEFKRVEEALRQRTREFWPAPYMLVTKQIRVN